MNLEKFLKKIAQIESSGGLNLNHRSMKQGIHKGTAAIGKYGLMPLTIKDIIKRRLLAKKDVPSGLTNIPKNNIQDYIEQNPTVEQDLAEQLAERLLLKHKGNELAAAYAWNMGSNLKPTDISQVNLATSPYVQKFAATQIQEPEITNIDPVQANADADAALDKSNNINDALGMEGNVGAKLQALLKLKQQYANNE